MINRRALSDVVTTVLIILLAIAAIAIVWSFVAPTLRGAGEKLSVDCINLEVEPTGCSIDTNTDIATITYQWKAGEGLTGVKAVVTDGTNTEIGDGDKPVSVLGTASVDIDVSGVTGAKTASVAAVTSGGVCSAEGATEITCS
jgi:hypothetical protein